MVNKRLLVFLIISVSLLLVPLIAMQFTKEVSWDIFDFVVAGMLLTTTAVLIEVVLRKVKTTRNRFILLGIVLGSLILIWAEMAVGIFGSPIAGS